MQYRWTLLHTSQFTVGYSLRKLSSSREAGGCLTCMPYLVLRTVSGIRTTTATPNAHFGDFVDLLPNDILYIARSIVNRHSLKLLCDALDGL